MTFQSSIAQKFGILIEEKKVYFSEYPDFPIYKKENFPDDAWEEMDIDFRKLIDDILCDSERLNKLRQLLREEFNLLDTPEKREKYMHDCGVEYSRIFDHFNELTDENFSGFEGAEEDLNADAYQLHCMIKYDISSQKPIDEYFQICEDMVMEAIYKQGYFVDTCVGEVIKVSTAEHC